MPKIGSTIIQTNAPSRVDRFDLPETIPGQIGWNVSVHASLESEPVVSGAPSPFAFFAFLADAYVGLDRLVLNVGRVDSIEATQAIKVSGSCSGPIYGITEEELVLRIRRTVGLLAPNVPMTGTWEVEIYVDPIT